MPLVQDLSIGPAYRACSPTIKENNIRDLFKHKLNFNLHYEVVNILPQKLPEKRKKNKLEINQNLTAF